LETIFNFLEFVNEQAAFHEKKAVENQGNSKRAWRHKETAKTFRGLANEIDSLRHAIILRKPKGINPLALTTADVDGLPVELQKQLVNRPENDKVETDVVSIINDAGGTLLLDHIIIQLFRRTAVIHDRATLVSKIYRMNKKGLVFSAPGKKGVYTTIQPSEEEAAEDAPESLGLIAGDP
jgi:hypothetical protein